MPNAINAIETGGEEYRFFVLDVFHNLVAVFFHLLPTLLEILNMADGKRVDDVFDAVPFKGASRLGLGALLAYHIKDSREDAVFVGGDGSHFGCLLPPGGVAMHLGTCAHEHAGPVDTRTRRDDGTLVHRTGAAIHETPQVGDVMGFVEVM